MQDFFLGTTQCLGMSGDLAEPGAFLTRNVWACTRCRPKNVTGCCSCTRTRTASSTSTISWTKCSTTTSPTWKLGGLVPLTRDAYDTACNWKLAMDTFGEMRHQPDSEWDITIAGLPVYWIFPNVILMPFRFGCFLVRAYPSPGEPGRYTTITTPTPESSDVRSLRC
jgi:hypothetical protein